MNVRRIKDKMAGKAMLFMTIVSLFITVAIGMGLFMRSIPLLHSQPIINLIFSSEWKPFRGKFGFYPFIMGSIWVTGISLLIAFPLCLLTGIYLSEYAHWKVKKIIIPFVDLLSGIPPVIFGVWGVLFLIPLLHGYNVLAGGIVLAIMIFPLIISILLEVFGTVPLELRDASLSLGATRWQTVKFVLLKKALPGIIAAVILAFSRAIGETIAVLMVCGNRVMVPHSVFDQCYPLPALIANNYGEMLSVKLFDSALLFAAFLLFIILFIFNAVARIILERVERKMA